MSSRLVLADDSGTLELADGVSDLLLAETDLELPYSDIVVTYDDTHIVNEARVTRTGGTTQVYEDATSQGSYLTRTFERSDVHTETDTDSFYAAQNLVVRFKDPKLRVESLTVQPRRDPDNLYPLVLDLDLLDVIEVKRRPQALGSAIDQTVAIEGITHSVTPETWTTTYQLGQLPPSGWVLEDATYGVLDETTRAAY